MLIVPNRRRGHSKGPGSFDGQGQKGPFLLFPLIILGVPWQKLAERYRKENEKWRDHPFDRGVGLALEKTPTDE